MPDNNRIIVVAGPTAVGKSSAAVSLALRTGGEVISADSMQVYRRMNIGTAKITEKEMCGIRHHMIDVAEPYDDYNVSMYSEAARKAVNDIINRGKIPIICGGTGFYIQAVLYGIDFTEESDDGSIRAELESLFVKSGPEHLHRMLSGIDRVSAANIPAANVKRVIRAIEYYRLHGVPISVHNEEEAARRDRPPLPFSFFVLSDQREALYERINKRVDRMFEEGLADEVKELKNAGIPFDSTAMQGIGYKELYYADGEKEFEEARELIKLRSRRYAKRQMTWFRREKKAVWIDINNGDAADEIYRYL